MAALCFTSDGDARDPGLLLSMTIVAGLVLALGYADRRPVRVHSPFSLGGSLGALVYLSRTYRLALITLVAETLALALATANR